MTTVNIMTKLAKYICDNNQRAKHIVEQARLKPEGKFLDQRFVDGCQKVIELKTTEAEELVKKMPRQPRGVPQDM